MKKLHFSVKIKATVAIVWEALWNDTTYRIWTSVFNEGSYAVTDWKEGSKILFLSSNGDGMYSTIVRKITNEFMSFKHLGLVKNGIEQPIDEETKHWTSAMENYTLKETEGITELIVEMDVTEDYQKYFNETFPQALEKVKELSENLLIKS